MRPLFLARNAMATRFEIALYETRAPAQRAAGEAALDEISRIENVLSPYRSGSEIAQLNARAWHESVRVSNEVYRLLDHSQQLSAQTEGAFDITIGPLVRCWGFANGTGQMPTTVEVATAQKSVGWSKVHLDPARRRVRFAQEGVRMDLGAIGKGYALDQAARILREAGVTSALLHGGTSSVAAIGTPPNKESWEIGIDLVAQKQALVVPPGCQYIAVNLVDESLSVSAISGRQFEFGGRTYGHVINPHTGQPVATALLAAVALPSATESDALSTALLVSGNEGLTRITAARPQLRAWLVERGGSDVMIKDPDLRKDKLTTDQRPALRIMVGESLSTSLTHEKMW